METSNKDNPCKIAQYWIIATRAQFAKPSDWQAWADATIEVLSNPPAWVIDMSIAQSQTDLESALEVVLQGDDGLNPFEFCDAEVGYVWWRYERGELSLHECLAQIGQVLDGGCSSLSCETIYQWLNELEASTTAEKAIAASVAKVLTPVAIIAKAQWKALH